MRIDESVTSEIVNRLRRAEEQVRDIISMLKSGGDYVTAVPRLVAAARTLDQAAFRIASTSLQQCLVQPAPSDDRSAELERLEKLFLSLT